MISILLYSGTSWHEFYESNDYGRVNRFVKMWGSQRGASIILICNYERVIFQGKAGDFRDFTYYGIDC